VRAGNRARAKIGKATAFSLIELLVVLAILLILTVMFNNQFSTSARKKEFAACRSNLQKIYLALSIYNNDNGAYPAVKGATSPAAPLSLLIPKSTTVTEIFICPGSNDKLLPEGERFAERRISYAYYMGRATNDNPGEILLSDWQVDNAPKRAGQLVFSPAGKKPGNNHHANGGNLLTLDGQVSASGPKSKRDLLFQAPVTLLNP
jgi:prepilin-type N-terminal cleavage/methylation domain-containing protein